MNADRKIRTIHDTGAGIGESDIQMTTIDHMNGFDLSSHHTHEMCQKNCEQYDEHHHLSLSLSSLFKFFSFIVFFLQVTEIVETVIL